jgi:hypothetical protein
MILRIGVMRCVREIQGQMTVSHSQYPTAGAIHSERINNDRSHGANHRNRKSDTTLLSTYFPANTNAPVTRRVSPLISFPLGNNMRTEGFVREDVTWRRFNILCSEEMRLREGCEPQLAWKFSDGRGSKEWITLGDEGAYKRMMAAAARRIRARAKKESNLEDPDLSHGWRIDLKVRNKVERIEEEEDEEDAMVPAKGKEKEKTKKRKKRSKEKVPKKRKRGGQKKAFLSPDCDSTVANA